VDDLMEGVIVSPGSLPGSPELASKAAGGFAGLARFDPSAMRVASKPETGVRRVNGVEVEAGTPLAYLMDLMESAPDADFSPEQRLYHERMRLEAAKAALPAVHARLAQVDLRAKVALTHEEALAALEEWESPA
jgi:hypothetical protein